jgi:hypothetical protein
MVISMSGGVGEFTRVEDTADVVDVGRGARGRGPDGVRPGRHPVLRALAVLPFVAVAIAVVPACAAEKICAPGEVVVERAGGGRSCERPEPGDRDCPDGEILLKNPDTGQEGCIPNRYSEEPYTDRLPGKGAAGR